jgi:hypothetical protein
MKALGLGAFDFVAKPQDVSTRMPEIAAELIAKIKAAANSRTGSVKTYEARKPVGKAPPRPTKDRRKLSPSEFPPAGQTLCSICFRSFRRSFRAPFWSCSTCRKTLRKCLPAAWMRPAPCA